MPAWWLARRTPARAGPGDTPAVCASRRLVAQALLVVCNCFDHAYCVGTLQLLFMRVRPTSVPQLYHACALRPISPASCALRAVAVAMQDPNVYVDTSRVALIAGLVAATSASHQLSNLLAVEGTTLVLQAERVGRWVRLGATEASARTASEWTPGVCYGKGDVVMHSGRRYRAMGAMNESEPGSWSCAFLQARPTRVAAVVAAQRCANT